MLDMAEFGAADLAAMRTTVKAHARIEQDGENGLIDELASSALLLCEAFCGRIVLARQAVEILPAASGWRRLGAAPVRSITKVEGLPAEGAAFDLPVGGYAIDIDADGAGWVRVSAPGAAGRVRITYQAGLAGDWDTLPEPLRHGTVRLATHLYVHRDGPAPPPASIAALWRPWRRVRL